MVARLGLAAILLVAAALRLWNLPQNGFGNEYYSATVRSMAAGWHNFLYASFDPAGFVSVDKPPLGLWVQVASVKLLGFHPLAVLLPQVLEGLVAVWLVWRLVERRFGAPAGLLAALLLALTPVSVAVDRSSNVDSCLVLILLLAAWALMRAVEAGRRSFVLLSMVLLGLGFNVKMLAALVVLPAFAAVYVLGRPFARRRWTVDAVTAVLVLVAVSVSWVAVYDLTPPERRPYAGTTDTNLVSELVTGEYGLGRFAPRVRASVAAGGEGDVRPPTRPSIGPAGSARWASMTRLFVRAPPGPLRLAGGQLAAQVAWLMPLAVLGVVLGARRERLRRPLAPAHLALILWSVWALTYGVVYSSAGGFFHYYYLATMAPPLAALAGIGLACAWQSFGERPWGALLLPLALLSTVVWQLHVDATALDGWPSTLAELRTGSPTQAWRTWLLRAASGGTLGAVAMLAFIEVRCAVTTSRLLAAGAVTVGVASTLVLPSAWALSSILLPGPGLLPSADLARLMSVDAADVAGRRASEDDRIATLVEFLRANRRGERWILATSSVTLAAPIIVRSGEPVMARGGFHGLDPILTPDKLARMVEARQVRFAMLGDLSVVSRRLGGEAAGRPLADWVRAHGTPVDPALWRPGRRTTMTLYDLNPVPGP